MHFDPAKVEASIGKLEGKKWAFYDHSLKAGSHVRRKDASISASSSTSARKRTCEPGRRKHKKKERFPFSCAYACVVPVDTYVFLRLCLCLRRTCEPALTPGFISTRSLLPIVLTECARPVVSFCRATEPWAASTQRNNRPGAYDYRSANNELDVRVEKALKSKNVFSE